MIPNAPKKQSALDLPIKGSMGDFIVSQGGNSSVRVNYLLSQIGLELAGDHQERLLSRIAPFREIFDTRSLDFDQIMQRDIDDARVSTELIPYLLESSVNGLVKLFPPIIVVLIPTEMNGKPAPYYPTVESMTVDEDGAAFSVVRSGPVGQEVFELRRWLRDGVPQPHDFAELRINTNRCKLVIVDGQHRAMSLLALYRNIKGWPDKTRSVEPYYKIWTPSRIEKFDLGSAKLPIMFCTFPQLDGSSAGNLTVHAACRSIFLALNKNARPVTRSRNILLDDRDVVAMFLRGILGYIKNCDTASSEQIRLSAIELDNEKDRSVLKSPVAITGVTHLNGLLERLMLGNPPQPGLSIRQNVWLATKVEKCFSRLGAVDKFTPDVVSRARRETCDRDVMRVLDEAFAQVHRLVVIRGLDRFGPYVKHHEASMAMRNRLEVGASAEFYRAILFDGEGMNRVFSDFQSEIDKMLGKDEYATPELRITREEFKSRQSSLDQEVSNFYGDRASRLLESLPRAIRENDKVKLWVTQNLYGDNLTTAAFQYALFFTFFGVVEQINSDRSKPHSGVAPLSGTEVLQLFDEYIGCLNTFFVPSSQRGFEKLVAVFHGDVKSDGTIVATNFGLKNILIPGELKPDEWPKFRAILQELWRPKFADAEALLEQHRTLVRRLALEGYINREIKEYCREHALRELDSGSSERDSIEKTCADRVATAFGMLGSKVSAPELLASVRTAPSTVVEE